MTTISQLSSCLRAQETKEKAGTHPGNSVRNDSTPLYGTTGRERPLDTRKQMHTTYHQEETQVHQERHQPAPQPCHGKAAETNWAKHFQLEIAHGLMTCPACSLYAGTH